MHFQIQSIYYHEEVLISGRPVQYSIHCSNSVITRHLVIVSHCPVGFQDDPCGPFWAETFRFTGTVSNMHI